MFISVRTKISSIIPLDQVKDEAGEEMKEEAKDVGKPVVDSWVDFKHFGLGLGVEVSEDYPVSTKKRKVNEGTLARVAKFSP